MAQKTSIPKGTRDFSPLEMSRRNYIFDTIKAVFSLYGFQQIETPAMENLSTLMGKYGEEGDKLLFKILNSGDWKSAISHDALDNSTLGSLTTKVSEKGLRYDLTVPFARFVVQHREEIQFPFKRYQIQPVWRADRPQKGRYREFYQCDVDVVGTNSLLSEVELIQIVEEVYRRLGIRVSLHINNRKILAGIAEVIGQPERIIDITVAIDKLDKIGIDNVNKELLDKGLPQEAVDALQPILNLNGTNSEKLDQLEQVLATSETGLKGIEELRTIFALYAQSTQDGNLSTFESHKIADDLEKERTLLHIYKDNGNWPDNLNILITNLRANVDNRALPDEIGAIRVRCGQRCMQNGICHYCASAFHFAEALKQKYEETKSKDNN